MAYFPPTKYDFPNVSNYDGDLRELIQYVRGLSEEYSKVVELAEKMETQYNDLTAQFEVLNAKVDEFEKQIDEAVKAGIDAAMIEYDAKIELIKADIAAVNEALAALSATVTNFYELSTTYTDSKIVALSELAFAAINDLQEQIDNLQWELPEVYNIVKGVKTDLTALIYDVYDACRDNAITAYDFDVYGLTAGEFDALNLTALEFDTQTKAKLLMGKCRNPFTGELDTVCNIIADLAQHTTDQNITAAEFDAAELTADEFNALNLTAYEFDFYAKHYIVA